MLSQFLLSDVKVRQDWPWTTGVRLTMLAFRQFSFLLFEQQSEFSILKAAVMSFTNGQLKVTQLMFYY